MKTILIILFGGLLLAASATVFAFLISENDLYHWRKKLHKGQKVAYGMEPVTIMFIGEKTCKVIDSRGKWHDSVLIKEIYPVNTLLQ